MLNWKGKISYTKRLGVVTMAEFEKAYNDMTDSEDKCPVASNIYPIMDGEGCTRYKSVLTEEAKDLEKTPKDRPSGEPLYEAIIFYEMTPKPKEPEKKVLEDM